MRARARISIVVVVGVAVAAAGCDGLGCQQSERYRLGQLAHELPARMCAEDYYRVCFDTDHQGCMEGMQIARGMCMGRARDDRVEVRDGRVLSPRERVTRCMGNVYDRLGIMIGLPYEGCTPETIRSGAWKGPPKRSGEGGGLLMTPEEQAANLLLNIVVNTHALAPVGCEPTRASAYGGPGGAAAVLADICDGLAKRELVWFLPSGFGGSWEADDRADLAIFLVQLPEARLAAEYGDEFTLAWPEHSTSTRGSRWTTTGSRRDRIRSTATAPPWPGCGRTSGGSSSSTTTRRPGTCARGRRARSKSKQQGQWLDNEAAAEFLRGQRPYLDGVKDKVVELPPGVPGQVILPDGTIVPATHAKLVPRDNGRYTTAFPIILKR